MIKLLLTLIAALPEIVKFLEALQAKQGERTLKDNLTLLRKAINEGDQTTVNTLFGVDPLRNPSGVELQDSSEKPSGEV